MPQCSGLGRDGWIPDLCHSVQGWGGMAGSLICASVQGWGGMVGSLICATVFRAGEGWLDP